MSIRVVVADDSPFICSLLTHYLESDPEIKVVETALNGREAMDSVRNHKPDVLTLDINMPEVNGLEALETIMNEFPIPVILISGVSREAARITGKGLSLGAVDFILKYSPGKSISPDALRRDIVAKVKAASRVRPVRFMRALEGRRKRVWADLLKKQKKTDEMPASTVFYKIAVIGASTGGPLALKKLLSFLDEEFPFCVVIVQHMPAGFTGILAEQFDRSLPFPVREAGDGDVLCPGCVFIAPGDRHMLIGPGGRVVINETAEVKGHRPSIDVTMQSAAGVFGCETTGVILSGMGDDGTEGLLAVKHNCGEAFAQSSETCVVDSMPVSAIENVPVKRIGSPEQIGRWLNESCGGAA